MRRHYHLVSLQGIDQWLYDGRTLPPNALAVTVDDGHRDFFQVAYPVFRAHGIPVTMFLTTGFLDRRCWLWTDQVAYMFHQTRRRVVELPLPNATCRLPLDSAAERLLAVDIVKRAAKRMPHSERTKLVLKDLPNLLAVAIPAHPPSEYEPLTWDEVRQMSQNNTFFGAHTQTHPILSSLSSAAELRNEIRDSRSRIEGELGMPVPHFSYPNGTSTDIDLRTVEEVKAAGFRSAVIAEPGVNRRDTDPFLLHRIPLGPLTAPVRFGRDILRRTN